MKRKCNLNKHGPRRQIRKIEATKYNFCTRKIRKSESDID